MVLFVGLGLENGIRSFGQLDVFSRSRNVMDLVGLLDMDGFLWIWLVFSGDMAVFRRTIIQLIHILVQAGNAHVTGKRVFFT